MTGLHQPEPHAHQVVDGSDPAAVRACQLGDDELRPTPRSGQEVLGGPVRLGLADGAPGRLDPRDHGGQVQRAEVHHAGSARADQRAVELGQGPARPARPVAHGEAGLHVPAVLGQLGQETRRRVVQKVRVVHQDGRGLSGDRGAEVRPRQAEVVSAPRRSLAPAEAPPDPTPPPLLGAGQVGHQQASPGARWPDHHHRAGIQGVQRGLTTGVQIAAFDLHDGPLPPLSLTGPT